MKILLNIAFILLCANSFAQNNAIKTAKEHQNKGYFIEASVEYEKILTDKKLEEDELNNIHKNLGHCYYAIHNYSLTQKYWELYLSKIPTDASLYQKYGLVLNSENKKTEAELFYKKHLKALEDTFLEQLYIANFEWVSENKNLKSTYQITKTNINTGGVAMGVAEWNDGLIVGFPQTQKDEQTIFYNLGFVTKNDSLEYSEPQLLSNELSTSFYAGYPSVDKANEVLYFTANSSEEKKFKQKKKETNYSSKGVNILKIYSIKYENNKWVNKIGLAFNSNEYSCTHPSISEDGKTIYFVSNMPGGFGGYDIYKANLVAGEWSAPINLGKTINTKLDEMTPFIQKDNLFFSSKGFLGYGGFDVYQTKFINDKYTTPKNMGKAINSNEDDFSFYLSGNKQEGYLSSNRDEELNIDNVYEFILNPFLVVDADTKEPIANVAINIERNKNIESLATNNKGEWNSVFDTDNENVILLNSPYYEIKKLKTNSAGFIEEVKRVELKKLTLFGQVIYSISENPINGALVTLYEKNKADEWVKIDSEITKNDGKWKFYIRNDREYQVEVEVDGYIVSKTIVPALNQNNPNRDAIISSLNPLKMKAEPKKDLIIKIDNIYFDYDKSILKVESYSILDNLVDFLNENSSVRIELSAHTDCIASDGYNLRLSTSRAKSAYNYLVKKGITKNRLVSKGYGKRKPLNTCEEQKIDPKVAAKNRRVEVKIL